MSELRKAITVMGIFALDLAFRTHKLPAWGETVVGSSLATVPGGKGTNQAIAAARLGAETYFLSKIGTDAFGQIAEAAYREAGVRTDFLRRDPQAATGAAAILLDDATGENAIVVSPGASSALTISEIDAAREAIARSACFLTQCELPLSFARHALGLARSLGVPTILNPAPAVAGAESLLPLCDYVTPNEHEAQALTGLSVGTLAEAEAAADALLARGARHTILTLGARGAFVKSATLKQHIPAFDAAPVVDTSGAGDAFNGGFAAALAEGMDVIEAARFGCAVAGIAVTRPGTSPSMPRREEVEALLARHA
jgi:ribokinase